VFETLHEVPWSDLDHAYGSAGDVPAALRALLSDDPAVREKTLWNLYGSIFHQGTRYEASAHAVPFLLEMVADPATPGRASLIELLVALAIGYDESFLPDGFPVDELRAAAAGGAELLRDGGGGWKRLASLGEDDQNRLQARIEFDAYEAVEAGVPLLVPLLGDPDPCVRRTAACALGWFPAHAEPSVPALRAALADSEPVVVATVAIALGLLGATEEAERSTTEEAERGTLERGATDDCRELVLGLLLSGDSPEVVRGAAAVALARGRLAAPAVVAELLRTTASAGPTVLPYLDGDLAGLAALSLRLVVDDDSSDAFDVLLSRLPTGSLPIAAEAMRRAFPDGPVPAGTPFADLTERQKRIVRLLGETPSVWQLANFVWLAGGCGLPISAEKTRAYAGTVNTP
jgi:HEAT repeat protein